MQNIPSSASKEADFIRALREFHFRKAEISPHRHLSMGFHREMRRIVPYFAQWHPPQVEQSWVQLEGISPVMAKVMVLLTAFISSLTASCAWFSSTNT